MSTHPHSLTLLWLMLPRRFFELHGRVGTLAVTLLVLFCWLALLLRMCTSACTHRSFDGLVITWFLDTYGLGTLACLLSLLSVSISLLPFGLFWFAFVMSCTKVSFLGWGSLASLLCFLPLLCMHSPGVGLFAWFVVYSNRWTFVILLFWVGRAALLQICCCLIVF